MKMFSFILWLVSHEVCFYSHAIFLWHGQKQTLNTVELIKRKSKVQENMSCEFALNFEQWKTFPENYKPMRVWLWLVYKFTENYNVPQNIDFSKFIQNQKRYPTSLGKIRILTWKLLVMSSYIFLWTKLMENLLLAKCFISVSAPLKFIYC